MRMKSSSSMALLLLFLALWGCAPPAGGPGSFDSPEPQWTEPTQLGPIELAEGEKLQVVASTTIVGDVVSFIGGSEIELRVLMPYNVDPHAYEPTPSDLRALSEASVVFINGLGLESSLYDYLMPLKDRVPVISLSVGIATKELDVGEGEQHQDEHEAGIDPHVWFNPIHVRQWAERIVTSLAQLDPAKAPDYEEHGQTYTIFLDNLDEWIKERVDQVPDDRRIIVSDHYVFGYFADRYGFEVVGAVIPVYSSAAEPSARELAQLEETIDQLGVNVIFVGETINPGVANSLAEDSGIDMVRLYTGSLSDPEGPASSYLNFMQYNVTQIVNALLK